MAAAGVEARYLVARRRAALDDPPRDSGPGRHRGSWGERSRPALPPLYGLRRHTAWPPGRTWSRCTGLPRAEAYVTPVSDDVVGIGLLFARPASRLPAPRRGGPGTTSRARLVRASPRCATGSAAWPRPARSAGAGPLRQDVARRVHGRVLLVGDASGLPGRAHRRGHRRRPRPGGGAGSLPRGPAVPRSTSARGGASSGPAWRFTAGVLWCHGTSRLAPALAHRPGGAAASRGSSPTLVNHAAQA